MGVYMWKNVTCYASIGMWGHALYLTCVSKAYNFYACLNRQAFITEVQLTQVIVDFTASKISGFAVGNNVWNDMPYSE